MASTWKNHDHFRFGSTIEFLKATKSETGSFFRFGIAKLT